MNTSSEAEPEMEQEYSMAWCQSKINPRNETKQTKIFWPCRELPLIRMNNIFARRLFQANVQQTGDSLNVGLAPGF